jgi:methionyl-tRNA synthetase
MVGKDILRFHAVYWPAFLMAADLPLPKKIFAHGWWTNRGEKISKSLGNVIDPYDIADRYGVDQVRYFLIREVPFGNDGDFSEEALISRTNSQLSNELGNLVQRTLSMVWKNCGEKIPSLSIPFEESDEALMGKAYGLLEEIRPLLQKDQALHKYVDLVWQLVGEANRYVDTQAPWVLRKNNLPRMEVVLYTLCEVIRVLGILLQPLIPTSVGKILDQLSVPEQARTFKHLEGVHALKPGTPIQEPQGIFPRLNDVRNPETC